MELRLYFSSVSVFYIKTWNKVSSVCTKPEVEHIPYCFDLYKKQ